MSPLAAAVVAALVALAASLVGVALLLRVLQRLQILDMPKDMGSHEIPTPRGAGLAVVGVVLLAWSGLIILMSTPPVGVWWVVGACLGLTLLSWIDDLKDVPPKLRLVAQAVAVAGSLGLFWDDQLVLQGLLPPFVEKLLVGLGWIWFINLSNFMDGIDGNAGGQNVTVGAGIFLLAYVSTGDPALGALAIILAAAASGFLVWNWQPAKIFLGDVGSVPLGFVMGWLLLRTAANGHWLEALIIPLYYVTDATVTLLRRIVRRRALIKTRHREHFYHLGIRGGLSAGAVVGSILAANVLLIACALLVSWSHDLVGALAACVVLAALLYHLSRRPLLTD